MKAAAYLYPWDVLGHPAAAEQVAGIGVEAVTVAAAYHTVRAATPRHPLHRVVTAPHAAVYYPTDEARWADVRLRPAVATWTEPDSLGLSAGALHQVGLQVNAWLVLTHNSYLGERYPDVSICNAFGDRYPWALCPAQEDVRAYAATLAAEVAARSHIDGIELEACGWFGFEHSSHHDKTAGAQWSDADEFLLSLCFCARCRAAYGDHGVDADELRATVRSCLDHDDHDDHDDKVGDDELAAIRQLLGPQLADAVVAAREQIGDKLRRQVIQAARAARPGQPLSIFLHADPVPHHIGSNPGMDPAAAFELADGLIVACSQPPEVFLPAVKTVAAAAGSGGAVGATFVTVAGLGAPPDLEQWVTAALDAGATDLRLYHAGLATSGDLRAMGDLLTVVRRQKDN